MTEIPSPPGLPLIGNARDVDPKQPSLSSAKLFEQYGRILRLHLPSGSRVLVGSYDILNEMCNEKRFHKREIFYSFNVDNLKSPGGALNEVRNGVGDGLFTAFGHEENWGLAHRILMPAFGPVAMTKYFDEMHSVACELITKWARLGPENKISPTDQFTRFTLDSIALCAMDTRFNSFDREDLHPFVHAMNFFLKESGARAGRPKVLSDYLYRQDARKYAESIQVMRETALAVINNRRANPSDKTDLLAAMLTGKDSRTGQSLPMENVINNMITFLIAGHETTSGLLSFLFVKLIQNPRVMKTLQKEVDEVLGDNPITVELVGKFPYLTACIRETLRLHPTATSFEVVPNSREDADFPMRIGKEGWLLHKEDFLTVSLAYAQTDPSVWGEDALEFKPERMMDDRFNKLPPNAWKPFGNGSRACIGRAFALQEAHMLTAMLLQNFTFRPDDPSYKLEIAQTLTVKPKGFFFYAKLRDGLDIIKLERRLWGEQHRERGVNGKDANVERIAEIAVKRKMLAIFYGSNTGTCEALAQSMANFAAENGYDPRVSPLDSATNSLPKNTPVVIITASYEGEPPDNAGRFVEWLRDANTETVTDVKYAVFGCGHTDWVSTYQKVPVFCDDILSQQGADRICRRGVANAADNDVFNTFDKWCDETFWPSLKREFGGNDVEPATFHGLDVEISTSTRTSDLRQDVAEGLVTEVGTLTATDEPEKRHMKILLPSGMTYTAGDYLAVLPINHEQLIKTTMARFKLPWDARCTISNGQLTFLPTGREMPIYALLASYVELNQPATQKNVTALAKCATESREKIAIENLTADEIVSKHISILDLLESYGSIELPFGNFLAMLPPMRVRQYSISSSPLEDAKHCTLTYGVLDQEARSVGSQIPTKSDGKRYKGVCSTYLSELKAGDKIHCIVKPSHQAFHLPHDNENVPVIMICAGSGLAPFYGFVQERAIQIESGRRLAPAMLFVGCRHPDRDALYAGQIAKWSKLGIVDIRYAFSKAPEMSAGCKYVQDRLWKDRKEVAAFWEKGAKLYVCGNGVVGDGVKDVVIRAAMEGLEREGRPKSRDDVEKWFNNMRNERYASDVFA